nr:TAXI family TRAP transporter solute-binding subunit [Mycobacterium sp. OAS707]
MTPGWQRIAANRPVRYLDWGDDVFKGFAEHGWGEATVDAGYLPGLERDLRTLDFADFVLLCRDDLDDDLAYLITWCMIRTRQALEAQYAMLPKERSPLAIPIDPVEMAKTPIPLHPAAERAYRDVGSSASAASAMWS